MSLNNPDVWPYFQGFKVALRGLDYYDCLGWFFTPWKITPRKIDIEPEHGELEDG